MSVADAEARLTKLFEDHHTEILAYCIRRIGPSDAPDVTSEVFATAWRRVDEIDWDSVLPFLYGIARGVLSNRWRSRRRWAMLTARIAQSPEPTSESPEVYYVRREQDSEVVAALSRLKESDQEILRLAAWEDLSHREIASTLNISVSAAEQRLHRAKVRLSRVLKPEPETNPFSPRAAEEGGGRR